MPILGPSRAISPAATLLTLVGALATQGACGDDSNPSTHDAGGGIDARQRPVDGGLLGDAQLPLSWVNFAISGCERPDPVGDGGIEVPCTGTAPLTLGFAATSAAAIDDYVWDFGDGITSDEASPQHTYRSPGIYDVALAVGGPGGTASKQKPGGVVARSASLGSPCDTDAQCGTLLECVCDDNAACGAVLSAGMCSADCNAASPCADGVCADLAPGTPAAQDWRRSLCLVGCADTSECPAGLTCQELRAGSGAGWVKACFAPGALGQTGDGCVDAEGKADDNQCASGSCLAIGARGSCSASCATGSCPDSAACATFVNGSIGPACLARCERPDACADDPWLACEPPGGAGTLDFTVDETAADAGYCAPKHCTAPAECGLESTCLDGFCAAL